VKITVEENAMNIINKAYLSEKTVFPLTHRYQRCVMASKRISWRIDEDVIRGREFDSKQKFLPDQLSLVTQLDFLSAEDQIFVSQIQGRTYANIFGLVERFINAKVLELGQHHVLGDQVALEALVRFSDEEIKHQELFRRIEVMTGQVMPEGYNFSIDPNDVAKAVLSKSTWAVLGLTCHIELFTQQHYLQSIAECAGLSPLYKDVFLFHWKEESQHAILDEIEWREEDKKLSSEQRDQAVDDLIDLVAAVDGILQQQAEADAGYFMASSSAALNDQQKAAIGETLLRAYRWQYISSGIKHTRFAKVLAELTSESQMTKTVGALAPLMQ
jgi:hypothetical protein